MELAQLLNTQPDARDSIWEQNFLQEFPKNVAMITQPTPATEHDGWPYLHVASTDTKGEPLVKILQWLSDKGIGLILNAHKAEPDYVFTYGMVWSFRTRGLFLGTSESTQDESKFTFDPQKIKFHGEPTEGVFPPYARAILRQFFNDQGIIAPKVLAVSEDQKKFDLCFSVESLGYPPEKEHQGILEALAWFFPPDYSLVLVREEGLPSFSLL